MPLFAGSDPIILGSGNGNGSVTEGPLTHHIFKEEDFPNFTSGFTVLREGVYILNDDISLGLGHIFENERSSFEDIQFVSEFKRQYKLTCIQIQHLFNFLDSGSFDVRSVNFQISVEDGEFLFMKRSGSLRMDDSVVNFTESGGHIGEFIDSGSFQHLFCSFTNFSTGADAQGLFLEELGDMQIIGNRYKSNGLGSGVIIRLDRGRRTAGRFISNLFEEGSGESVLYISPLLDGALLITENTFNGDGDFFQKGLTGNISSINNGTFAYPISSVSDAGNGNAQFNVPFIIPNATFDEVFAEITGFTTNTDYNGIGTVKNLTATSMEIISDITGEPIPFIADEAGGTVTTRALIMQSLGHSVVVNDAVLIRNSVSYNDGYTVVGIDTDEFTVNFDGLFSGTNETGEWDTGSLDQRDPRIECRGNRSTGGPNSVADSMVTGGWRVTVNNSQNTSVDDGSYNNIIFDPISGDNLLPLSSNERITVTNRVNGEIRYDGLIPRVVKIPLSMNMTSTAGTRTYNIKGSISRGGGAYVDLPDNIETDVIVQGSNAIQFFRLDRTVLMENGDTFKWQIQGDGTSLDFLALNADIQI